MIYFKRRIEELRENKSNLLDENIQSIIKSIEESSDEQREIVKKFKVEMEKFVIERSLESCMQTLNLSMQLANIREQLLETYKLYCHLLEAELKKAMKGDKNVKNEENKEEMRK